MIMRLWRRLRQSDTIEILLDANAEQSERITDLSTKLLAAEIEIRDWIAENDRLRFDPWPGELRRVNAE